MTLKVDGTNGLLQAYDYQVLTTGFSYTFASGTQTLIANPAGTLATGTITMPAAPADGMTITFSSTKEISTLTVNANTGQSITGTPGVLPANTAMSFVYRLSNTTWYPTTISANGTLCRAWVNCGSAGAIAGSFNVSSVTYTATGLYAINFTNAFADANYAYTIGIKAGSAIGGIQQGTVSTTQLTFQTFSTTLGSAAATTNLSVAVFR